MAAWLAKQSNMACLQAAGVFVQREDFAGIGAGKEAAGLHARGGAAGAGGQGLRGGVVGGELVDLGRGRDAGTGGVDGEGGGIVIGMAALVRMGEHGAGVEFAEDVDQLEGDVGHFERSLLVQNVQRVQTRTRHASDFHGCRELAPAGVGVILGSVEAGGEGGRGVAGRAIGEVDHQRAGHARQHPAGTDGFIIGMRCHHHHRPVQQRLLYAHIRGFTGAPPPGSRPAAADSTGRLAAASRMFSSSRARRAAVCAVRARSRPARPMRASASG